MLQTVKFHDLTYTQQDDFYVITPLILRRQNTARKQSSNRACVQYSYCHNRLC